MKRKSKIIKKRKSNRKIKVRMRMNLKFKIKIKYYSNQKMKIFLKIKIKKKSKIYNKNKNNQIINIIMKYRTKTFKMIKIFYQKIIIIKLKEITHGMRKMNKKNNLLKMKILNKMKIRKIKLIT
jgi:hypothetical protein